MVENEDYLVEVQLDVYERQEQSQEFIYTECFSFLCVYCAHVVDSRTESGVLISDMLLTNDIHSTDCCVFFLVSGLTV